VRDDLEEDRDDEFVKVCDKLLELEMTGHLVSIYSRDPDRFTHL
jgi:hypothetical protein